MPVTKFLYNVCLFYDKVLTTCKQEQACLQCSNDEVQKSMYLFWKRNQNVSNANGPGGLKKTKNKPILCFFYLFCFNFTNKITKVNKKHSNGSPHAISRKKPFFLGKFVWNHYHHVVLMFLENELGVCAFMRACVYELMCKRVRACAHTHLYFLT